MLLTACLIVRDEAAHLEACLASVRPFVDDVVVADTGSSDDTVAIARAAGARVVEVAWADDFAGARNAALAMVTSAWVLSVDADERVTGDPAALRALVEQGGPVPAYQVLIEQTSAENPRGLMRHRGMKLFRPGLVRWQGRVHERVVRADGSALAGLAMPEETLAFTHLGYATADAFEHRARRNARLAELELMDLLDAAAPAADVARARLDLGRSLISQLDPERGRVVLHEVRAETTPGEPAWLWATDFLAWDALRHEKPEAARDLLVELDAAGAPADYLLNLAAAIAEVLGDYVLAERFRSQITRRVSVTGQPG